MPTTISIVIPVYRSESTIQTLYVQISKALKRIGYTYEIIFVDDGSTDRSWDILLKLYSKDRKIQLVQLSRNFGQHNALMCGFSLVRGKYIITMDDDLQNPPEEMNKLIKKIEEGFEVVYGQYEVKKHSTFRNLGSIFIQWVYRKTFQVNGNLTSFRIIRKGIIKEILKYNRNYTFIDGLIAWQTKNIGYTLVKHNKRTSGKSNYTLPKLISLSLNMVTNFSIFPLQLATILGFCFSFMGLALALFYLLKKIIFDIPVTGFTSIILAILIFSGVQLLTLGLIGEYLGRIHLNINQKPQYTIRFIKKRNDS